MTNISRECNKYEMMISREKRQAQVVNSHNSGYSKTPKLV
jgi:hypothetical protein